MIQNEKRVEVFIASKIQNILHILILNLENSIIIPKIFYHNYLDNFTRISRFLL